jgi:F-type H+-transporting ATPase subunit b
MHLLAFAESIQLFPDGTIFIHIALILFMIWVLNRTLFKPINTVLAARDKHKAGEGGEAGAILKSVNEKETVYSREMLDTRSKGYEMIEKEQAKATAERDAKLGEVKTEVAGMVDTGKAELAKQTAEARASIGADAEKIADSIAASILKG